jgi:hypothetical protein
MKATARRLGRALAMTQHHKRDHHLVLGRRYATRKLGWVLRARQVLVRHTAPLAM